jgi:hypothetical protein
MTLSRRAALEGLAQRTPHPEPFRRYLAALAAAWPEAEAAEALIGDPRWPDLDPAGLLPSDAAAAGRAALAAQAEVVPPIIERERRAFVAKESGRLQAVMRANWLDEEEGLDKPFHPSSMDLPADVAPDPGELALEDLARLPSLTKRVERLGTLSFSPLFQVRPEDRSRLALLDRVRSRLAEGAAADHGDVAELLFGHEAWLRSLTDDGPRIVMPGEARP